MTPGYKAKAPVVLRLLNDALSHQLMTVCVAINGTISWPKYESESVESEFLEHAEEEQEHADAIAERDRAVRRSANVSPEGLLGTATSAIR